MNLHQRKQGKLIDMRQAEIRLYGKCLTTKRKPPNRKARGVFILTNRRLTDENAIGN